MHYYFYQIVDMTIPNNSLFDQVLIDNFD